MSRHLDIIALIRLKPGKAERAKELIAEHTKWVQENESGTLGYKLLKEVKTDSPILVVLERYTDGQAVKRHIDNSTFKAMERKFEEEDLWAEPMKVIVTKSVAGFRGRL